MFASAGIDLKFYNCPSNETEFQYSRQQPSNITTLSWSKDNSYIVLLPWQASPEIISIKNNHIRKSHTITALKDVSSVAFQKTNNKSMGMGTIDGQIAIYDIKRKSISKLYPALNSNINCIDFDEKDETLAIADTNNTVNILNLSSLKLVSCYKISENSNPNIVKYHKTNGNMLATATEVGDVCIWDVNTSQKTFAAKIHTKAVGGLALGNQNDLFISAGYDRKFCVHDLNIKECIFRGNLQQPLSAIDISNHDDFVVIGTEEGMIYVYDFRFLLQPLNNWKAYNKVTVINKIEFANDGKIDLETNRNRKSSKNTVEFSDQKDTDNDNSFKTLLEPKNVNLNNTRFTLMSEDLSTSDSQSSNVNSLMIDMKSIMKNKTNGFKKEIQSKFNDYKQILMTEFRTLGDQIEKKLK